VMGSKGSEVSKCLYSMRVWFSANTLGELAFVHSVTGVMRMLRLWGAHRGRIGEILRLYGVIVLADDHSVGCFFYQSEQHEHRHDQRACALDLCYAHPSVRLGLRLLRTPCLLPCSGSYLGLLKATIPA
jgi:hypothetical protein